MPLPVPRYPQGALQPIVTWVQNMLTVRPTDLAASKDERSHSVEGRKPEEHRGLVVREQILGLYEEGSTKENEVQCEQNAAADGAQTILDISDVLLCNTKGAVIQPLSWAKLGNAAAGSPGIGNVGNAVGVRGMVVAVCV